MQRDSVLRCDLQKQYKEFRGPIFRALKKVLTSRCYILGDECKSFEEEFAAYCGSNFGIAVASGTEALYLSLRVLGIGKTDEVITSPFTPIPTVSAIIMAGARPVFSDISRENLLIDTKQIVKAITLKTKAIIPVHLFGNVVNMDELRKIANKYNLVIIEDACQAHGSSYRNKKAGSWGDLGCFSFYPTKNLGGYGDGGLIITDDAKLAKKLKLLRDYGRDTLFTTIMPGVNSRLDEIQAAILRIKLHHLDRLNEKRRNLADLYFRYLKNTPLQFPIALKDITHNYHIFTVRCPAQRDALKKYLEKDRIQTNIYYPISMHLQKAYQYLGYKKGDFPISEQVCKEILALPMYPELAPSTVKMISQRIASFFKNTHRKNE